MCIQENPCQIKCQNSRRSIYNHHVKLTYFEANDFDKPELEKLVYEFENPKNDNKVYQYDTSYHRGNNHSLIYFKNVDSCENKLQN